MASREFLSAEVALCTDKILRCIGRVVALVEDAGERAVLSPPVAGANSLAMILNHVLANAEENLLGVVGGHAVARERATEFDVLPDVAQMLVRWNRLRPEIETIARGIPSHELFAIRPHTRRGDISIFEVFLVVLRHLGEHEGHAQLTWDWVRQSG